MGIREAVSKRLGGGRAWAQRVGLPCLCVLRAQALEAAGGKSELHRLPYGLSCLCYTPALQRKQGKVSMSQKRGSCSAPSAPHLGVCPRLFETRGAGFILVSPFQMSFSLPIPTLVAGKGELCLQTYLIPLRLWKLVSRAPRTPWKTMAVGTAPFLHPVLGWYCDEPCLQAAPYQRVSQLLLAAAGSPHPQLSDVCLLLTAWRRHGREIALLKKGGSEAKMA